MENFIKKGSLMFAALQKLHNKQDCDVERKKQLKKRKMINSDCSLTVQGKTVLYAGMLEIPVMAFKTLALCYAHRKIQTREKLIPVYYQLIESLFKNESNKHMRVCIKHLINNNLAEKHSCRFLLITDSTYSILQQHDADITEIEKTFEY